MSKQSKALRLAEWCETFEHREMHDVAAELRRLHALNQELVKALKWLDNWMGHKPLVDCAKQVRAAIAKAKEQT